MANMTYKRTFQLTEYWDTFLKETGQIRERTGATESNFVRWDKTSWPFGGQSVVLPPETITRFIGNINLKSIYQRDNLALKVFYTAPLFLEADMYMCFWGTQEESERAYLVETSKIQNLFAKAGLAPRVYDLIFLERNGIKYATQVTDFVKGNKPYDEFSQEAIDKLWAYAEEIYVEPGDSDQTNFKKGQFLDFQRFLLKPSFKPNFIKRVKEGLIFGSEAPYQSVEKLHIKGVRDNFPRYNLIREDFLKIKDQLPENFTALDFGCNGAFFLRRAFDWGATYGVGVDIERVAKTTEELMYYLGYFNADLVTELPNKKFDVTFFLSMDLHYPFENVVNSIGKVLYLEGHANGDHPPEKYYKMLQPHFSQIEHLGKVSDFGERNIFRAIR